MLGMTTKPLLTLLAAAALLPGAAQAASVTASGDTLTITAADGEKNQIYINEGGNGDEDRFTILERQDFSSYPADRCEKITDTGYLKCTTAGFNKIVAKLGDGDDSFSMDSFAPAMELDVDGGAG